MTVATSVAMAVNYNIENGLSSINYNHLKGIDGASALDRPHYYSFSSYSDGYGSTRGYNYKKHRESSLGLSVLTLLAFLFFLHILQSCIQEQDENLNPQIIIMQAKAKLKQEEKTT